MSPETLQGLRELLQLGWPALVTVFLIALYRDYRSLIAEYSRIFEKMDTIAAMLRELVVLQRRYRAPDDQS